MTSRADVFREWDAAYVLGALSTEDRRTFERHLPTCPACAAAVAELAGLPGILGALPAAAAAALDGAVPDGAVPDGPVPDGAVPPEAQARQPHLVQRLAAAAVQRNRRSRIRLAAALGLAAAVIGLAGGLLGATLATPAAPLAVPPTAPSASTPLASSPSASTVLAMEPLEPDALSAALTITETEWGTRFDWSCVYLNQLWTDNGSQDYDMVMTDRAGTATVLATWTATGRSTENLAASTDLPSRQIRSVEIRARASGVPLARSEL